MPNILMIVPRSTFLDSDRVFPNLGVLYLKSALELYGIEVTIEDDFTITNSSLDHDLIGISATTPQRLEVIDILTKIKKIAPDKKIVIGGPYASYYTEECKQLGFDCIILGEGEKALLKLLRGSNQKIIKEEITSKELNKFPLPYRSNKLLDKYSYLLNGVKATSMITSRGCPFKCAFCEHANTKVKYYHTNRIESEIEQITQLGYKAIMFFDDLFAVNKIRVKELCDVIKNFKIHFRCFGHATLMTDEIAKILASAGCVETGVGVESGDQSILNIVKHPTPTIAQCYDYVKICHNAGIRVKAFLMLGLPNETKESIKKTEKFIATSGVDDFDLTLFYPYCGTEIRNNLNKYDIHLVSKNSLGYYKGINGQAENIVSSSKLSAEYIKSERERIHKLYKM